MARPVSGSLSAEVERILRSSSPPRPSEPEQPPESSTYRVHDSTTPARGPAIK
jgi:hypothetical protein